MGAMNRHISLLQYIEKPYLQSCTEAILHSDSLLLDTLLAMSMLPNQCDTLAMRQAQYIPSY